MSQPITIVFPLYPGLTQLDFTGPHQFFARTPGLAPRAASVDARPISSCGLVFSELEDLATIERCDVLCVPGGAGCQQAMEDAAFMGHIQRLAATARYLTSVCTGSLILGAAGYLVGRRAACHWAWRDLLPLFGAIPDDARVVRDGNILTGGGVTAGIDFALTVIAELLGDTAAQEVQLLLEYAPAPPFNAGRPEAAPIEVREALMQRQAAAMAEPRARIEKVAAQALA